MSGKHTPGPWAYHRDEEQTVRDADGLAVAFFVSPTNARLIAAAPDLLDALKRLLAFVEAHTLNGDVVPPHTVEHERSRAAIAKAEATP